MNLLYLTARYPYARTEAFLTDEILHTSRTSKLFIVPLRAGSRELVHPIGDATAIREPLFSFSIFAAAVTELSRPIKVFQVLSQLLCADARPKSILRNIAIIPKALWVTRLVRRLKIQHIHAHWVSLPSSVAWVASQLTGVPWSFTAHRYDIDEANALTLKLKSATFARAISDNGKKLLQRAYNAPVRVLHMGVRIPSAGPPLSPVEALRIVVPANLVPVKGHKYLLQGLLESKRRGLDFYCTIAGAGPLRRALEKMIDSMGLEDCVVMAGAVRHDDLLGLYENRKVDVVMLTSVPLPSGEEEGIPVALLEAMSFGIPVIGTLCGAIPELIGDCGILIPPRNAHAIADALGMLRNTEVRSILGAKGRQRVQEQFDVKSVTQELRQLMLDPSTPRV